MQASSRTFQAETTVGILGEGRKVGFEGKVNLWADSVGDAVSQLGLLATLAMVARIVVGLLSELGAALR
jgi:hypothetical protein